MTRHTVISWFNVSAVNIRFEQFFSSSSSMVQQHDIRPWPSEYNLSTLVSPFFLFTSFLWPVFHCSNLISFLLPISRLFFRIWDIWCFMGRSCQPLTQPPSQRTRSPYLWPPETGCPSYTPTHWVSWDLGSTTSHTHNFCDSLRGIWILTGGKPQVLHTDNGDETTEIETKWGITLKQGIWHADFIVFKTSYYN